MRGLIFLEHVPTKMTEEEYKLNRKLLQEIAERKRSLKDELSQTNRSGLGSRQRTTQEIII